MAGGVRIAPQNYLAPHKKEDESVISISGVTVTLQTATGVAATTRAEVDSKIRLLDQNGNIVASPVGFIFKPIGFIMEGTAAHSEPSWLILDNGKPYILLVRNATITAGI